MFFTVEVVVNKRGTGILIRLNVILDWEGNAIQLSCQRRVKVLVSSQMHPAPIWATQG
jgi:hypothetical protein